MMNMRDVPVGTTVHFTNWPGRKSVEATRVDSDQGNIEFVNGYKLFAFDDEVFDHPVEGLEHRCSESCQKIS